MKNRFDIKNLSSFPFLNNYWQSLSKIELLGFLPLNEHKKHRL